MSTNLATRLLGISPQTFAPALSNFTKAAPFIGIGAIISLLASNTLHRVMRVNLDSNTGSVINGSIVLSLIGAFPYTPLINRITPYLPKSFSLTPDYCPVGTYRMTAIAATCLLLNEILGFKSTARLKMVQSQEYPHYHTVDLAADTFLFHGNQTYEKLWENDSLNNLPYCFKEGIPLHQGLIPWIVTATTKTVGVAATVMAVGGFANKLGDNFVPTALLAGAVGALFFNGLQDRA